MNRKGWRTPRKMDVKTDYKSLYKRITKAMRIIKEPDRDLYWALNDFRRVVAKRDQLEKASTKRGRDIEPTEKLPEDSE